MKLQIISYGFVAVAVIFAVPAAINGSYGSVAITAALIAGVFINRGING